MTKKYTVVHYESDGKDVFQDWLDGLRDVRARTSIARRVKRVEAGNFGEHRPCRDGVWELVINYGPGYRVYYSLVGEVVVLLLCAGDKRTQQSDIDRAIEYLKKFKGMNRND